MNNHDGLTADASTTAELDYLRGEVARLRNLLAAVAAGLVAGAGSPETDADTLEGMRARAAA